MFTGLVETLGIVEKMTAEGLGQILHVAEPALAKQLALGESVAVNGVCLTVVGKDETGFRFQVGPETLRCTNLGALQPGNRVNLERALAVGDRLGGHFVQGHVDGLGNIEKKFAKGNGK
jgi:riboflavin synthase